MASWACSLRYRLVRWVRLTRLTTFLGEGKVKVGEDAALPVDSAPGSSWHLSLPADVSRGKDPSIVGGTRGGASAGGCSPPAASAGGAAAQQGALATLGAQ